MNKYPFKEVGASVYAWDMHDESVEAVLDNLEGMAHVNSFYLVALMHEERHPWPENTDFLHNPARKEYMTEDSVAYWHVDAHNYGRIVPAEPRNFLKGTDWLALLVKEARQRNMKVGMEFSHTLIDGKRLEHELADVCQIDIFGKPLTVTHIGENHRVPCMNHPDFREYAKNLYTDVVTNYDIDYVLNCIMPYPSPATYLLAEYDREHQPLTRIVASILTSGCFCPSCQARAKAMGFNLEAIRRSLLVLVEEDRQEPGFDKTNMSLMELLMKYPDIQKWFQFKCASVASFHREISECVHKIRPGIDNRLNMYVTSHPEYAGFWGKALAPAFDSVRICCYTENLGIKDAAEKKRRVIRSVQKSFGKDMELISAIGVLPGATPDSIRDGLQVSSECGVSSIALGHYDGASFDMLKTVGAYVGNIWKHDEN